MTETLSFEEYYRKNLNLPEEEHQKFMKCLNEPLPVTLRIENQEISKFVEENYAAEITKFTLFEDISVLQLKSSEFQESSIKKAIIQFTESGWLYRQELVSMLPVLFLQVEPNHRVLDMCAAPGSKTTQILGIINKGTGLLISNDSNARRCEVVRMHARHYANPRHLITANDARLLPNFSSPPLRFNRILCDVPCSGDGTMRKSVGKIDRWKMGPALALSEMQFLILKRGLDLLEDDGLLCYSTCSLNPIENEAVIQRAVNLLDCETVDIPRPPLLKTNNGLITWDPCVKETKENLWLFPSKLNIGLEKCVRILPHENDTGGFFVALLRKKHSKKTLKLRLDSDDSNGVALEFDYRKTENFFQAGFHLRDLKTNENAGISFGAKLPENEDEQSKNNKDDIDNNKEKFNKQEISDKMDDKNQENKDLIDNKNESDDKTQGNEDKKINNECEKNENFDISGDLPKKILRKGPFGVNFYETDSSIHSQIENQYQIKIEDVLITQSIAKTKLNSVSKEIFRIIKQAKPALRIISAGCLAFQKLEYKDAKDFRASKGFLKRYNYNGPVIDLNLENTLIVIDKGKITNNQYIDQIEPGCYIFRLFKNDELFCGFVSKNTTEIYISKKTRAAIKTFLTFYSQ